MRELKNLKTKFDEFRSRSKGPRYPRPLRDQALEVLGRGGHTLEAVASACQVNPATLGRWKEIARSESRSSSFLPAMVVSDRSTTSRITVVTGLTVSDVRELLFRS